MLQVAEMEAILQAHNITMPAREVLVDLAEKFRYVVNVPNIQSYSFDLHAHEVGMVMSILPCSSSAERSGKFVVQMKQVRGFLFFAP